MASYEIKNLRDVFIADLQKLEFVGASVSKLTAAGENYVGVLFAVDIKLKDGQNEKIIRAVAKTIPKNEFLQTLFNTQVTFRNEVAYYEVIAPCLRQFQKEQGFKDLFGSYPEFYGARLSLAPESNKVDEDCVLLIKNLKDEGFTIMDRKVGFDLDQSRLILDKMAELHGTSMALKMTKPEIFDEKLNPFLQEFKMYESNDFNENVSKLVASMINLVKDDEFCSKHLTKIRSALEANMNNTIIKNHKALQKGRFLSLVHCDMWTNNIMVKVIDNNTVHVKFVDYQIYEWSSVARDVIFFLFTSVQLPLIQKHCDDLFFWYFNCLIKHLKELGCDVSEFTFEDFLTEVDTWAKRCEFFHVMLMQRPIFALDDETKEAEELEENDFVGRQMGVAAACRPKASFIVQEFIRRKWI